MKNKKIKTAVAFFIMLTTLVFTISPIATALLSKSGSITLHVADSTTKTPLAGATFRLYHIADAHESGKGVRYEFLAPYDKAGINLNDLQDSYLPVHLAHFAVTRNLPYTVKASDATGLVTFNNLTPGIYLILPWGDFGEHFIPPPFVINIPQYNYEGENWEYDIVATPKLLTNTGFEDNVKTYISVQKKWDTTENHPNQVTVVLLKNMEEYDRVVLNAGNNWYHRWDSLEKSNIWNVVEINVPDGYTVTYETSSNTVTIINKYEENDDNDEEEGTTNPGGGEDGTTTPGGESGEVTTRPGESGEVTTRPGGSGEVTTRPGGSGTTKPGEGESNGETTEKNELIDTGQLNWPVPVMATTGLIIFSIGWAMLNLGKKETD